jgi:hypothetical protein
LSYALANLRKDSKVGNKTATPAKRSSHGGDVNDTAIASHDSIIHLQKTIGNQAVQRLMRSNAWNNGTRTGIQTKLKISQPGDMYEQEADRIAEQVMRMSTPSRIGISATSEEERIDRKCSACKMKKGEDEEEERLNISRKPSTMAEPEPRNDVTNDIGNVLSSDGSSLDDDTKAIMESRFGYGFTNVRVHKDTKAAESAQQADALAYSVGQDIIFGTGQYAPRTKEGQRLLAHELAHVLQHQKDGQPANNLTVRRQSSSSKSSPTESVNKAPAEGVSKPKHEFFDFQRVFVSTDREFNKEQLLLLIGRVGLLQAQEWLRDLIASQGRPKGGAILPLGFGGRLVRSPLDVQRSMQDEELRQRIAPVAIPLVVEVFKEIQSEVTKFLKLFEDQAKTITHDLLRESEVRVETERNKYGLTKEITTHYRKRHFKGETFDFPYTTTRHGMSANNISSAGLVGAAKDLKSKWDEVMDVGMKRFYLQKINIYTAQSTVKPENRDEYERLGRRWEELKREYDFLKKSYEIRYPILADIEKNPDILKVAQGPSPETAALLNESIDEKLGNINRVREELKPGGRVLIWKLPEIVALTKAATGATPLNLLGRMRMRIVDDEVQRVIDERKWRDIALAALAIALAAVAAIPTGGSSLAVGAAALATIGSLGLSVHQAAEHIQEFQLEKAMTGTDFDKARAISTEDPSLFWLAVDILGVALDVGPALRGTRQLLDVSQRTFRTLLPSVKKAISVGGSEASEALAEMRRAAENAEYGGPLLASRATKKVELLRSSGTSVERTLAGAAGHEAAAVGRAAASVASEAENALSHVPTRLGNHTISVTRSGRLIRCSITCEILSEEYAIELARHPDLARRWSGIRDMAATAAGMGNTKLANEAANQARLLADDLEAFRRTGLREAYKGRTMAEVKTAAMKEPAAVDELIWRYEKLSTPELDKLAKAEDGTAAYVVAKRRASYMMPAEVPLRPSNLHVLDRLKARLSNLRKKFTKPKEGSAGGTFGVAETDLPLKNNTFEGASPRAGGIPDLTYKPPTAYTGAPGHAEQNIVGAIKKAIVEAGLEKNPGLMKGKTIYMFIEQEVCPMCKAGIYNESVGAGVLKQFSDEFPDITVEVMNIQTGEVLRFRGGQSIK